MSNLSQYRMSLALFSLGLLWVVSEVVGDGEKPGPLDSATKSFAHRLRSANDANGEPSVAPYELAVSQEDPAARAADADGRVVTLVPSDAASRSAEAADGADESERARLAETTPPDVGLIHK